MKVQPLIRLDETLWAFQQGDREIRISTPGFSNRASDYRLANKAREILESNPNATAFECSSTEQGLPDLLGKWQIVDRTKEEFKKLQEGSIIYKRDFTNLKTRVLQVQPESYFRSFSSDLKKYIPWMQPDFWGTTKLSLPFQEGIEMFFENGAFSDPFTKLAALVFQRDETPFISEHESKGSYHFILENGILQLQHNSLPSNSQGSAAALSAFRDFIRQSYEWRTLKSENLDQDLQNYGEAFDPRLPRKDDDQFLGYLKTTFGIDFDAMLKEKKALLPDHVYKCCIAANQIEIGMVESLYLRIERCLKAKLQNVQEEEVFPTALAFYNFLKKQGQSSFFSYREIDGIYQSFAKYSSSKSLSSFKHYLSEISTFPSSKTFTIHSLTPKGLDRLMDILFIGLATPYPEHFFTGRKILHLAICGYKTMGDKNIYDPCRNVSELLHIFPHLKKGNLLSYNELLAHVVVKKGLHQCYPSRTAPGELEWRVGRLIPFIDKEGLSRWYYVDGYLNDKSGDVNYVLLPASRGYLDAGYATKPDEISSEKKLPLIKLYRSTASDKEAESSIDSLLADLNPRGIGSLNFNKGDDYERPYFQRCTMPVWAGYLLIGDVDKAVEHFRTIENTEKKNANGKEENLLRFLTWQQKDRSFDIEKVYQEFKKRIGEKELDAFFHSTRLGEEWAKYNKVAQDIHFTGHSLGAALSQQGLYHFGTREGRIPLTGCDFKCFAYDPPGGVTDKQNQKFLAFGRQHKELLQKLGQKWEINYQFEYQDFVPQGGERWLGISEDNDLDSDWLELTGLLFKPKSSANDLAIITMPTHGRRFNHISSELSNLEYEIVPVSKKELYTFKTAYLFPNELRNKFGFNITTPRMTEGLRGTAGVTAFSLLWLKKTLGDMWAGNKRGEQDAQGVRFYGTNSADVYAEEDKS